jgi:4-hydroxy-3-methylbut-2-enyl diphosphate reductase
MHLHIAKTAGLCHGVNRALRLCTEAAARGPVYVLGALIHNKREVARLASLGAVTAETADEIPPGATAVIRAHGVSPAERTKLNTHGCTVIDATCPDVARIHRIAENANAQSRALLIFGEPDHPEVIGYSGCHEHAVVCSGPEALAALLREGRIPDDVVVVAQTTWEPALYEECVNIVKKECTSAKIFDTICGTTAHRQRETAALASRCGVMLVVGDRASSNTRRLYELARSCQPSTYWVEGADGLSPAWFHGAKHVGITAGASTPAWIIEEVCSFMEETKAMGPEVPAAVASPVGQPAEALPDTEASFEEMLESSIKTLNSGDKVTGTVISITPTEIQVDLGSKQAAYIAVDELSYDDNYNVAEHIKVGDEITTFVVRVNDVEGMVSLSKKRLDTVKAWEDVELAVENHAVMEGSVVEQNKGGVVVSVRGVRVFVPASATGIPRDGDLSVLIGKKVPLRIMEVNRRRAVGSIRAAAGEARRANADAVWSNIEAGKKFKGTVRSVMSYGAFVDIGGVDGMVHVSELSWNRNIKPSELVKPGDELDVYVISFDPEKRKISLGHKDPGKNPWTVFTEGYAVGQTVPVKVRSLMPFGAFAEICPGVDGLIHISQLSTQRVIRAGDAVAIGQQVDVKITEIDNERKKVSLSIRALLEDTQDALDMARKDEPDEIVASSGEPETKTAT